MPACSGGVLCRGHGRVCDLAKLCETNADCASGICDAKWTLLYRQTKGHALPVSTWQSGYSLQNAYNDTSRLNELENFRGPDGKLHLKLVWPERQGDNYQEWKQSTNPVTAATQGVVGYEGIKTPFAGTTEMWGGLQRSKFSGSLMDGSVYHPNGSPCGWAYFEVGSSDGRLKGPSWISYVYNGKEDKVELYAYGGNTCVSCTDGTKNGDETSVDCGGARCGRCPDSKACLLASDCMSNLCTGNVCISCNDTTKNGLESGVDCGGTSSCPRCGDGGNCATGADCGSAQCESGVCTSCFNSITDGGESGVDCGGSTCASRCKNGLTCDFDSDCASGKCGSNGQCRALTTAERAAVVCANGGQGNNETDVDCGGPLCLSIGLACANGKTCGEHADCDSGICASGVCVSCSDGAKNGEETGVDCGGVTCGACGDGGQCKMPSDCSSGQCEMSTNQFPIYEIDGGGWMLVRRVAPGLTWHPATDQLTGSEPAYGTSTADPTSATTFGIPFESIDFDQFMFATGDSQEWLIANRSEVERIGSNFACNIEMSSTSKTPYTARWYHRVGVTEGK